MNYLIYLRTFLDTYRAGSLTRAAGRLGITQPAASAHIASLEEMLGKPLFIRQARGVTPTAAADDLARSIASQLDGIEATMGAAQARSSHMSGTVHLVGPAEYLSARIGPALAPLVGDGLRLRIQTGNRERIYAALDEGHADLAVTASPPDGSVHGFAELGRERLMLVAAPAIAERAKARTVTAEFLCGLPCIAYDETLPLLYPFFEHVFGKVPDMQAVVTAPDLRILIGMAQAGTGWTVLPDYLCAEALATGQLVELPTIRPGPDNTLYLVWNKTALRHPRVVHVRDFLLRAVLSA
ncbi:LysR family transcriptional regulator [Brucella intermedia GD04153]|uniref:LysR family transcriptional regulator n=1 Tax=Brucella intermedia GD04153 TaxID=2975438 RepID=A0AA42H7S0_9HYPH|nr:LysR family transcriptional regulator [Brucella intermedia]MDH0127168.1 LysR family transcriptional regulator [Brucella intermedia GD04153]RRD21392.1 LysR family transcriptional regulator [Brucellaceae bacterium VT-16-1752]